MNGKHILLSLGACFYDGMDCITFDQLYRRADTAMYDSKKNRDTVRQFMMQSNDSPAY